MSDQIRKTNNLSEGAALLTIIVFGTVFSILIGILVSTVVRQEQTLRKSIDQTAALQMADAGLENFRWYLAHYPQEYGGWDRVAADADGAYRFDRDYLDPVSGNVIGLLEYEVEPEIFCGITQNAKVNVTATSFSEDETYSIQQQHAKDTAANYAYIYNNDVRAGDDRFIRGRYHSNGEVMMNGVNDSVVSSSQTSGVYGNPVHPSARDDLWQDEVGTIDFNALALDLTTIKNSAINSGTYFPDKSSIDAYEVKIVNDCNGGAYNSPECSEAQIEVWELSGLRDIPHLEDLDDDGNLDAVYYPEKYCGAQYGSGHPSNYSSYDDDDGADGSGGSNEIIDQVPTCDDGRSAFLGQYSLDTSCPVAFFEKDIFLYGEVDAKLLIASGLLNDIKASNVFLFNTIDYDNYDGSDGLTVVSEGGIKIPYSVPDDMGVRGIFLAQSGRYGRDFYGGNWGGVNYSLFRYRDFLQTVGSIVSNEGGGTRWVNSSGTTVSGFYDRDNFYDRSLSRRPPPLTPAVSENFTYIEWRDQQTN